jgi:hypothetical protein
MGMKSSVPAKLVLFGSLLVASVVSAQDKVQTQKPPVAFPEGFKKIFSQTVTEPGDIFGSEAKVDSDKLFHASSLWLDEKDPAKKLYAKVRLQALLYQLYKGPFGPLFSKPKTVAEGLFNERLMEILAGDRLDQSELKSRGKAARVPIEVVELPEIKLPEHFNVFWRSNGGKVWFGNTEADFSDDSSLRISLARVSDDRFQVFFHLVDEDPNLEIALFGRLFDAHGKVIAAVDRFTADAGCFGPQEAVLFAGPAVPMVDNPTLPREWPLQVRSSDGKILFNKRIKLINDSPPYFLQWSISLSESGSSWIARLADGGPRGWYEANYDCWDVNGSKPFAVSSQPKNLKPANASFRFLESREHAAVDSNGEDIGYTSSNRHAHSPLVITSIKNPAAIRFVNEEFAFGEGECDFGDHLVLPRTIGGYTYYGTWPGTHNFFVDSEMFDPVYGRFLENRGLDGKRTAPRASDPGEDVFKPNEHATFFYDSAGSFHGWGMGFVAGDGADGKSLLLSRTNGDLITVSPGYKVKQVRQFFTPDGTPAKPVIMLDANRAGLFVVGKRLVLGIWKAPLIERLFRSDSGSSGKK